jgi:hypothetical protein
MKNRPRILIFLFISAAMLYGIQPPAFAAEGVKLPFVVSTQWLADHQNDRDIVMLQVSQHRKEYAEGHIHGYSPPEIRWNKGISMRKSKEPGILAAPGESIQSTPPIMKLQNRGKT